MAKKEFTGVVLTLPTCRLAWPHLFEPQWNEVKKKEEWSVTMLFDKNADLKMLKQAMVQAARNEFGANVNPASLDLNRIQDGDKPSPKGKDRPEFCKGMWVVKAATRLKAPGVVDGKLNKIIDPTEIYSGMYANVNVTVKGYKGPSGDGVTLYLNHVQKVKDGEPLTGGPKAQDVFEAMELDPNEVVAEPTEDMDGFFNS